MQLVKMGMAAAMLNITLKEIDMAIVGLMTTMNTQLAVKGKVVHQKEDHASYYTLYTVMSFVDHFNVRTVGMSTPTSVKT